MKIYRLDSSEDSMALASKGNTIVTEQVRMAKGKPLNERWAPQEVYTYKKGKKRDFPHLRSGFPIFIPKVIEVVHDLIDKKVELLPLLHEELELYLGNVTEIVDCLDVEKSNPRYYEFSFRNERIAGNETIFKIPERIHADVFVTDAFRDRVLQAKLKGFEFTEVWDTGTTDDMRQEQQQKYEDLLASIDRNKGQEFAWNDMYAMVEAGKAMASGKWKLQADANGEIWLGQLADDLAYHWMIPAFYPLPLYDMKWHEAERSAM